MGDRSDAVGAEEEPGAPVAVDAGPAQLEGIQVDAVRRVQVHPATVAEAQLGCVELQAVQHQRLVDELGDVSASDAHILVTRRDGDVAAVDPDVSVVVEVPRLAERVGQLLALLLVLAAGEGDDEGEEHGDSNGRFGGFLARGMELFCQFGNDEQYHKNPYLSTVFCPNGSFTPLFVGIRY